MTDITVFPVWSWECDECGEGGEGFDDAAWAQRESDGHMCGDDLDDAEDDLDEEDAGYPDEEELGHAVLHIVR